MSETTQVPVSDVVTKFNMRDETVEVSDLMESIKQHGLMNPPHFVKRNGEFVTIHGHRRVEAKRKLGSEYINGKVFSNSEVSEDKRLVLNVVENMHRKDPEQQEYGNLFWKLHDKHDYSVDEIASLTGKTKTEITDLMKLVKTLPKYLQSYIGQGREARKEGKLPRKIMKRLTRLAKRHSLSEDEMEELIKYAQKRGIARRDLGIVEQFLKEDFTVPEAIERMDEWEVIRPQLTINKSEFHEKFQMAKEKHGVNCKKDFFKLIYQGVIDGPSLLKPYEDSDQKK
jgi:ParB family chromosome partitioning protein